MAERAAAVPSSWPSTGQRVGLLSGSTTARQRPMPGASCAPLSAPARCGSRPILPDNGKEFTDRLFGLRQRAATGAHECDTLGTALDIDHRLTPPRSPQTNGMVERFNGRIEEVLQSHPFRSGEVSGSHAASLCLALHPAAAAISPGQQDAFAGNEGMAKTQTRAGQETAILPSWMGHIDAGNLMEIFMRARKSHFATISAAIIVAGLTSSSAFALAITNGTTATLNDGVFLDASPGIQTNAFSRELSINDPDNTITAQGKTNPGANGPAPVYTNDPAKGNVALANLPVDNAAAPKNFLVHFNPNEPAAPSKKSITMEDVVFASAGIIIWDFDEKTYGPLELDRGYFRREKQPFRPHPLSPNRLVPGQRTDRGITVRDILGGFRQRGYRHAGAMGGNSRHKLQPEYCNSPRVQSPQSHLKRWSPCQRA